MLLSKRIKGLLWLLAIAISSFGQQYPSKHITTIDGLSNNSIYATLIDSRGILWVGTANGLTSIINSQIKSYFVTDGLAHNSCWSIVEDGEHNLWFASHGGGLTFYDGNKFKIINSKSGLINDNIRKLFIHDNLLYVGTEHGISVIDIKTKQILFSKEIIGVRKAFQVMDFFFFQSKVYFGTYNDGTWYIDVKNKKIGLQNHQSPDLYSIFQTNNKLIVCHGDTKSKSIKTYLTLDFISGKESLTQFGNTIFWNFVSDKRGNIYGAGNGINFSTGGLFKITDTSTINFNEKFGIESYEVWSLSYDSIGDFLYVGTIDKGLYRIDLKEQIGYFSPNQFNKVSLEAIGFESAFNKNLVLHKKGLFFLKNNHIIKELNPSYFHSYIANHLVNINPKFQIDDSYRFMESEIREIEFKSIKLANNTVWVNSTVGLFGLDSTLQIKRYYPIAMESYCFKNQNNIYYQVSDGLSGSCQNQSNLQNLTLGQKDYPLNVNGIFNVSNQIYYVSSTRGLYRWDGLHFYSFFKGGLLKENELICPVLNHNKQLIVANRLGDIFIVQLAPFFKLIQTINRNDIQGKSICFIDTYGETIIIGTEKGINMITKGKVKLINEELGLINKVLISGKVIDSKLFVGTLQGYYELNLSKILFYKSAPNIIKLTSIEVNNKNLDSSSFSWGFYNSNTINLKYDENNLSLSFEQINHSFSSNLVYRYKLLNSGFENWSSWNESKTIRLSFIPIGNYKLILEFKDLSSGDIFNSQILTINVIPPFWKTWPFMVCCSILLLLIAFYAYNKRLAFVLKQERAKGEINKRLAETKLEALQSQMNPHFIFNAMNSIQNYIIDEKVDNALMYLGEFSKLIRQTLNNSSKQKIRLNEELSYIERYVSLENMRINNSVEFVLTVSESIDSFDLEIPPMLIQPFVENAFLHAFNSKSSNAKLEIDITKNEDLLVINIIDNGKGMDADKISKIGMSKGIQLVKERINLLNGNLLNAISIESKLSVGTRISLRIKI